MSRIRTLIARLRGDARGVTIIEFAIVTPVMLVMLTGLCDLGYQVYAQAILNGAVQKAGRDSSLEQNAATSAGAAIDATMIKTVKIIAPSATYNTVRRAYSTFANIKPESYTDANGDGEYDKGECFEDTNGNATWDADPGKSGQGGADDAVVYDVTVTYPRIFPAAGILGWSSNSTITARTVLKNQPYNSQAIPTAKVICT